MHTSDAHTNSPYLAALFLYNVAYSILLLNWTTLCLYLILYVFCHSFKLATHFLTVFWTSPFSYRIFCSSLLLKSVFSFHTLPTFQPIYHCTCYLSTYQTPCSRYRGTPYSSINYYISVISLSSNITRACPHNKVIRSSVFLVWKIIFTFR